MFEHTTFVNCPLNQSTGFLQEFPFLGSYLNIIPLEAWSTGKEDQGARLESNNQVAE